jgi:uncharacterized protein YcbX
MLSTGQITSIVRNPVKSMAGESLNQTLQKPSGLEDHRLYAFQYASTVINQTEGLSNLRGW